MSRAARVDHRCDARANTENVGVNTERAKPFMRCKCTSIRPGVTIRSLDVNHCSAVGFEIRRDGVDDTVGDANVEEAVFAIRRIEQSAAFQEKISQLSVHSSGLPLCSTCCG